MGFRVNGKNLAVGRLMVRGKDAEKRLKYLHVGPKGVTAVGPVVTARVSLPKEVEGTIATSQVIPQEQVDALKRPVPESKDLVELPDGEPAATGPHYLVPQIDRCFPAPEDIAMSFTCNGDLLRKLLTVACEVCEDSDKALKLRFCPTMNSLRVDTYRQPGDQEFIGVIKGLDYEGDYIPGDLPSGKPKVEKKPQQSGLALKASTGRRFRGVGE
jgi:hypothetical protein